MRSCLGLQMFAQIASYSISHCLSPPLRTGLLEVEGNRNRNWFSVTDVLKLKLKPTGHEKGNTNMGGWWVHGADHIPKYIPCLQPFSTTISKESCRHQHSTIKVGFIQEEPSHKTYHFHGIFRTCWSFLFWLFKAPLWIQILLKLYVNSLINGVELVLVKDGRFFH